MDFPRCLLYKTAMSKSILTHFITVLVLHVALIFTGWKTVSTDLAKNNVPKLGNGGAISMTLGGPVRSIPLSPVIRKVEKKVVTNKPTVKVSEKLVTAAPKVEATPAQVSAVEGSGGGTPGTGGSPNGHEFGSGDHGTGKFDAVSLYKAELRARIDKNKSYPPMSKRLGQTGIVVVAFTLLEDGNIINIRLDKPSRYERLNDSALDAVKKVVRFKPIPKEVGENKLDVKVPLKFVTI